MFIVEKVSLVYSPRILCHFSNRPDIVPFYMAGCHDPSALSVTIPITS